MRRIFRFRNLQQKLGFYSFLVTLIALAAVSFFGYGVARSQIQSDRSQLMEIEAGQIAQQLETELNTAAHDVQLWGEMDVIQAGLTSGKSEQPQAFLDDLLKHHAKYDLIFTVSRDGRLASVNHIAASAVGQRYESVLPEIPSGWIQSVMDSGSVTVKGISWVQLKYVNDLYGRTPQNSPLENRYQIILASPAGAHSGQKLGVIVAIMNWSAFQRILDGVEERFKALALPSGYAFLYANDGDTITAHKYRDVYGTRATIDHHLYALHDWILSNPTGTFRYHWREGWKISAPGRIHSEIGTPFDWYLGAGINESDIFAPVQKIFAWFVAIPVVIAASVLLITLFLGRNISVSLAEFAQLARDAARGRFSQLARARTDDELGQLAQAFNEMLVSFRAQMPFTRIPNPYVVGNPIRKPDMFFGRHEDLEWIGHQFNHAGNQMILLFGPRRIGKTSLLHQIHGGQTGSAIIPFFFDTQQIMPETQQDSDFYHVLTREMLAQLPAVLPNVHAPFIAAEKFTPQTFRKLLAFIRSVDPARRPVLLFDELENLELKLNTGVLTPDVLLFLASLLDSEIPVGFVATGSDPLETLDFPAWNILRSKTISRRIGLLASSDAERLIIQPVRGYVLYDNGIPEQILRLTAGHPYYTQVICQIMVDYLNHKRDFAVAPEQLVEIVDQVL
jgi:HAMP domain-containing protein